MNVFPGWEQEGGPPAPLPPETDLYAHVEGLVGEEEWLEGKPEHEREPHHHERLAHLRESLDRLHDLLARRRQARP
jgi:hypothetical protein